MLRTTPAGSSQLYVRAVRYLRGGATRLLAGANATAAAPMFELAGAIHVRPFCLADARSVEPWLQGGGLSLPPGPAGRRWPERMLADARIVARVAAQGSRLLGFVRLDCGPDRIAEVTLVVAPGSRRRGLGGLLFEAALVHARQLGVRRLVASIEPDNSVALEFFLGRGFRLEGMLGDRRYRLVRFVHAGGSQRPLDIDA